MADATAFKRVCGEVEAGTGLSALEARGTVRLALKQAGFDAKSVNPQQMSVVTSPASSRSRSNPSSAAAASPAKEAGPGVVPIEEKPIPICSTRKIGRNIQKTEPEPCTA